MSGRPANAVPSGVLVRVEHLVKHHRAAGGGVVHAVDDVSFELRRGETLGLVGESGCGKSTLVRCLTRLHDVTSGRVLLEDQDLTTLSQAELRPLRRRMQMVFQDPMSSLNPRRRVGSIIADPLEVHCVGDKATRGQRVKELMELVGLNPEHHNRFPAEFSGGQRQRIGIARAIALQPELLVCDEPVSALDVSIRAGVLNLLQDLQREFQLTCLFVSHDLAVVEHVSDRVAVMYLGKIVEISPTAELFARPRHSYTRALLASVPPVDPDDAERARTAPLLGDPPSPLDPPGGCRFHPRCPKAQDACRRVEPKLHTMAGDAAAHLVACHHPLADGEGQSP